MPHQDSVEYEPLNGALPTIILTFAASERAADGTWSGAIQALDRVADLGFNVLLPLPPTQDEHQDCWGYDPLNLHAVHQPYGTPHDLKNFVNEAHKRGIAVLLDWVPNHLSSNS